MKSTSGAYFQKLDHVRALAAYLVFVWHFAHLTRTYPIPKSVTPAFAPLSLLEEGHIGVSLFMVLSGYLFTKIIADRDVDYPRFFLNRALRLAPLLVVSIVIWCFIGAFTGHPMTVGYLLGGFIRPMWPGGAWSITVEMHFYLLFPALLWTMRRTGPGPLVGLLVLTSIARLIFWRETGSVFYWSYWTIVGRIDQFIVGMVLARTALSTRTLGVAALIAAAAYLPFLQYFNHLGGWDGAKGSWLWGIIPGIEALVFGLGIAWYDRSSLTLPGFLATPLALIGAWSYSIYLLHFFLRVWARTWPPIPGLEGNLAAALLFATACFIAFLPIAAASYYGFEIRFLKRRAPYLRSATTESSLTPRPSPLP